MAEPSARVERMLREAPRPWSVSQSPDGLHALVDADDGLVARGPMFGWLRAIAEIVNDGPEHLRDDAPFLTCSDCGRRSWSSKPGDGCGLGQPDGSRCGGTFQEPAAG